MGGEGSMMAANQSLKNNRNQLKRKDRNALSGSYANIKLKEFLKATAEELQEIKERIQKENKEALTKQLIYLVVFIIALFIFLILI